MSRRQLALVVMAGLVLVGVVLSRREMASTSPVQPPPRVAVVAPRFQWATGTAYVYAFTFTQNSQTLFMDVGGSEHRAPVIPAVVDLQGRLVLSAYGNTHGVTRLGLRLESLPHHSLTVLGKETLPEEPPLLQPEAYVDMESTGRVAALHFRPSDPEPFKRLVQLLTSEMQVRLGDAARWSALETTQHGDVQSAYSLQPAPAGGHEVARTRVAYQRLQAVPGDLSRVRQELASNALARLASGGHLERLTTSESIVVTHANGAQALQSESQFSLQLLRTEPFDVDTRITQLKEAEEERALLEIPLSEDGRNGALLLRTGGLTPEQLLADLERWGSTGHLPEHNKWLWKATGLLQLQPQLCQRLVPLFRKAGMDVEGRALILDLLVGAGHAQAQGVLRRLLDTREAQQSPQAGLLYQRLSLVKNPSTETMRYLADRYQASRDKPRNVAAYALGSGVGHRYRAGDPTGALKDAQPLADDLRATRDPARQVGLIEALGNAGLAAHQALVASYSSSSDVNVRLAAAAALRKLEDPQSRAVLLSMLQDSQPLVQQRAMQALDARTLGDDDLQSILGLVQQGRMAEQSYQGLVTLLQPVMVRPVVQSIFGTILEQPLQDPTVKSRIRNLMGG